MKKIFDWVLIVIKASIHRPKYMNKIDNEEQFKASFHMLPRWHSPSYWLYVIGSLFGHLIIGGLLGLAEVVVKLHNEYSTDPWNGERLVDYRWKEGLSDYKRWKLKMIVLYK